LKGKKLKKHPSNKTNPFKKYFLKERDLRVTGKKSLGWTPEGPVLPGHHVSWIIVSYGRTFSILHNSLISCSVGNPPTPFIIQDRVPSDAEINAWTSKTALQRRGSRRHRAA